MKALIAVDLQNDFCPGGALEVKDGHDTIPVANRLMAHFELVVATKDWHPANHKSFAANHPWRKPGQTIDLNGIDQILWPIHCVQESFGSEFVAELNTEAIHHTFYKGTDPEIDSYSGFFDNGHRRSTGLGEFLREKGVKEIFILGLATDYCVKYSVMDALKLEFTTHLVIDGCRGIDLEEGDIEGAISEMKAAGAEIIHSHEVISVI